MPDAAKATILAPTKIPEVGTIDKLVELANEARGLEIVTLKTPRELYGLPTEVQALVKHTPAGVTFERLRPLFEDFKTAPERRVGTAKVTNLQSFVDLVNRHKDENTAIFAVTAWPKPALTAVVDYHTKDGAARFGQHRIVYEFPLTEEFKAWMAQNGEAMGQAEFALFLENHVAELTAPMDQEVSTYEHLFKERIATPGELVNLSRSLEIHVGQKVKRQERVSSGERTVFFEDQHMTATGEPVEIPGLFMISVPAFVDGDPIRFPARLRYRLKGGDVLWFYQLYRPEFWLRAQVQNDLATVAEETGLPTYEGVPEL